MYLPDHFRCDDTGSLHAAVVAHPLGTLITQDGEQVVADEVPFLLDPTAGPLGTLRAHVARNNPLWLRHSTARPVLVVFKGPQAYVSPAWYPGKAEHGKVVPRGTTAWCRPAAHCGCTMTRHGFGPTLMP